MVAGYGAVGALGSPGLSVAKTVAVYSDRLASFVALLRAINVGGTGILSMDDLRDLCETAGFRQVRTSCGQNQYPSLGESSRSASATLTPLRPA